MDNITALGHLKSCAEAARNFTNGLVGALAEAVTDAVDELAGKIEDQGTVTQVTLTAAGWEGTSAPYTQTVAVSGAVETAEPLLVSALPDGAAASTQKAYVKAFGIISSGTAVLGNGTATFKVYKKPAADIIVGLRGVM